MIRLGFIDYFLDEWHANNYPDWLRRQAEARGIKLDLGYAWADCERGLTTDAWCRKYRMRRMQSQEALIEACDAIIVLSPDHPEQHERLGRLALESGKRVYMDKTFAPDLACGVRLFDRAQAHGTPLFSSSALRFSRELEDFRLGRAARPLFCATTGPGVYENYSVHQLEMINTVMGGGAKRVKALESGAGRSLWIDFDGRIATMTQTMAGDFAVDAAYGDSSIHIPACTDPFVGLIDAMLSFFAEGTIPVAREQTLEVIAMRDAGFKALAMPDTWIEIEQQRG
jgi:hypothetical protein